MRMNGPQPTTTADALRRGALAVLADGGVAAATSRRITAASAANLAAITYHFGSKEALLTDALLGEARRWLAPVLDALRGDADPVARTAAAVVALQQAFAEARPLLPAYFDAIGPVTPLPDVRAGVTALLAEVREFLRSDIARQLAAGSLPSWVDPPAMADLQLAVVHGVALQSLLGGEDDSPAMASQFLHLLIAARP